jgi:hypothetical protein
MRPLLKNESVADEELIEVMSSAMAAESERATKFNQVGRVKSLPKVSKIETGAPPRPAGSPNAHDSDILATLKAIQAELNTVQSEGAGLRTKVDQKDSPQGHPPSNTFMTGRVVKTKEIMAVKLTTPHCVKNATKRIKLIVLIVSNVEEESTLPDIAGRETRGGYP